MRKLIELDAAIAETWKDTGYSDPLNIMTAIRDRLEALPTVDAVPVVRCAVCRYFRCNMRGDGTLPNGVDEFECVLGRGGYDPMDFCSEGEQKDGEAHD